MPLRRATVARDESSPRRCEVLSPLPRTRTCLREAADQLALSLPLRHSASRAHEPFRLLTQAALKLGLPSQTLECQHTARAEAIPDTGQPGLRSDSNSRRQADECVPVDL